MADVAIVIPTHNSRALLAAAVDSVLRQTLRGWELLIVDDGSTDDTPAFLQSLDDSRIRWLRNDVARGPSVARNLAILGTGGEYIAFLDADDEWDPPKLERQVAAMKANRRAVLAYTDYARLMTGSEPQPNALAAYKHVAEGEAFADLLQENFVCTSTAMVRRSELSRAGLFDPVLRYAQDYDLWLRLARIGELCYVPECLATYRLHGANNVLQYKYAMRQPEMLERIIARHADYPSAMQLFKPHLGKVWLQAGWSAWQANDFAAARKAFYRAARCGVHPGSSYARAAFAALPGPIARGFLGMVRKLKGNPAVAKSASSAAAHRVNPSAQ